jgi:hypothetical protein
LYLGGGFDFRARFNRDSTAMAKNILAIILLATLSAPAWATLHVAPTGDDRGDGSADHPLATLAAAQLRWRATGDRDVQLSAGTYDLAAPLTLTVADNGTADHPLTIAARPGEQVTVTGEQRLGRLAWKPFKDGIYSAAVPAGFATDHLFVNGQRQTLARYPNRTPGQTFDGYAPDAFDPARAARWSDPAGGFMHALHDHMWGSVHWTITGKKPDGTLAFVGGTQMNRGNRPHKTYRFVEGIFEELDAPGEWFLNGRTSTLYFMPPAGLDLATADVAGVRLKRLIDVAGTPDAPVRFVRLAGLTFTGAARTFMDTREAVLRSDWCIDREAAVYLRGAEDVSVDRCTLTDLGGNGIFLDGHDRRVAVRDCHLSEIGASGIMVVGRPSAVRDPVVGYKAGVPIDQLDTTPGPCGDDYPADCRVDDCLIHRTGRIEKQTAGVCLDIARRITVSHCSIYEVPRAGINIGDGCWGGHRIEFNDVFDTVLETGDHGSFNSWGRDRFWTPSVTAINDRVKALPGIVRLDTVEPIVLFNNRWRCDHGYDVDLDDGSSRYVITNNLCLNRGIKNREGYERDVENNVTVNSGYDTHVWPTDSGDVFAHNIVWASHPYRPIGMPPKPWGKSFDFNLVQTSGATGTAPATALQAKSGRDAHSIVADAKFIDPAHGNYDVRPDSPAIALGFKNFPMDAFGVTDPALRAMARTPVLPDAGGTKGEATRDATPRTWLGVEVRNVASEAEMSAYGTAGVSGVLVLRPPTAGPLARAGLAANDVIRAVDGKLIDAVTDLPTAAASVGTVMIVRQQQNQTLTVAH